MDNVDFAVIGSGGAGLIAAMTAAMRGARVVVLERSPRVGGTTAISGGAMWLPGNRFMEEQGSADSLASARTYLQRLTLGRTPSAAIDAYLDAAPRLAEFLLEKTRLPLEGTDTPDYQTALEGAASSGRQVTMGLYDGRLLGENAARVRTSPMPGGMLPIRHAELQAAGWGHSAAKRWATVAEERMRAGIVGRGRALVSGLFEMCLKESVEVLTDARAVRLIEENGRVRGVAYVRAGREMQISSRLGVMLASGGFEWDPTMWNTFVGLPLDGPLSPPFNTGDGIRMGMLVGALVGQLSAVWWMPSISVPGEEYDGRGRLRQAQQDKALPGAIVVNRRGRRFASEAMNYHDFGKEMVRFDPHTYEFGNYPAFVIFDERHQEQYGSVPSPEDGLRRGWLRSSSTLTGLAEAIGVDPTGLEDQVSRFNRDAVEGKDTEFHRGSVEWELYRADGGELSGTLGPIEKSPFYAYRLSVGCFGTNGGLVTDENARVMRADRTPIAGLYAAGNVAAGIFSGGYPGGGATLGPALVFGRVGALHATR